MSTLISDFQPVENELPLVAFVRVMLAPVVCSASLATSMILHAEPFTAYYAMLLVAAFLVSLWVFGELPLTSGRSRMSLILPGRTILVRWLVVLGVLLFLAFAAKLTGLYSRKVVLSWLVLTPFALQAAQEVALLLLHRMVAANVAGRIKVIVGVNDQACELTRRIADDPCRGKVMGYFDDRSMRRVEGVEPGQVLGRLADVPEMVKRKGIDIVYITLPLTRDPRIMRLLEGLRDTTASIYFVPTTLPFEPIQARVEFIGGIPAIAVCETPFNGINGVLKRAFDIVVGGMVLLLIWPLLLAISVGIGVSSPGPVLFRQRRYGLDGKEILVCKFRTMTVCEDGERMEQARKNDPRITRFGMLLRKTSLDELPQLFNVIAGSMSLVGPRPHAVMQNEQYRRLINGYMIRHKIKPGITGWAQVNGWRGETETLDKMQKRVEYDLDYLKHWSLSLDFWILVRTAWVVMRGNNAY